ncbi:hypothetical protein G161_03198 [Listeria monocytogenes FSL F6-684]|nr:hypothetical protein G161_03198 [Listeria monocytogenes FSL F6-684]
MDLVWTIIIQLVLSYVATVTFAIITNVPKRALNACGITGTFGWMAYWTLMQMDSGTGASSLAGAFVVAVLSHFFAKHKKNADYDIQCSRNCATSSRGPRLPSRA